MKFLITGNTGFKGSWLTILLKSQGHDIYGVSLKPDKLSLYKQAGVKKLISKQFYLDIRNSQSLKNALEKCQPDFIIHLAAQSLVLDSYLRPRYTIETNVNGTFNLLAESSTLKNLKAILVVTTDKVYQNIEERLAYKEEDKLGGHDPYSASKAMADIMSQSWAKSFPNQKILIARAGNVIGGGDFSKDRLIPDLYNSFATNSSLKIRNFNAVRPWQHVLDCLSGYLILRRNYEFLHSGSAWNFGPEKSSFRTVGDVLNECKKYLDVKIEKVVTDDQFHEANFLMLDSSTARDQLNWREELDFSKALEWTIGWYQNFYAGRNPLEITFNQVDQYLKIKNNLI